MSKESHMRIVADPQSSTGYSAAILLRGISPRKFKDGSFIFAERNFAGPKMNLDGYRKAPRVHVKIFADVPKYFVESQKKKKIRERALANSPMLI
jgi:hypothetical protein